jgi:DNA polymerase III delta subunit
VALRGKGPSGFLELAAAARERLATGGLPPLVVLAGEEPFLKERLIDAAVAASGGSSETFAPRAGESDAAAGLRLLDLWRTPTLFGGGRLIVARGADGLLGGTRGAACEAILDGPPPPHRLLLTVEALDGRSRLAKRLKEDGALIALPPLRDSPPPWQSGPATTDTELNQWIRAEAALFGLRVDLAVADELGQRIGNEPAALSRKLEQLSVLLGRDRTLTLRDVRDHVRRTSARLLSLYEDALRAGDVTRALDRLDQMLLIGIMDASGRLVSGDLAVDSVLRRVTASLARVIEVHEKLTPALRAALAAKPWERRPGDAEELSAIFGGGGGARVFLERDAKALPPEGTRAAFELALGGLRALRDGQGLSLHALTVRLCRVLSPPAAAAGTARAAAVPPRPSPRSGPRSAPGSAPRGGGSARW